MAVRLSGSAVSSSLNTSMVSKIQVISKESQSNECVLLMLLLNSLQVVGTIQIKCLLYYDFLIIVIFMSMLFFWMYRDTLVRYWKSQYVTSASSCAGTGTVYAVS